MRTILILPILCADLLMVADTSYFPVKVLESDVGVSAFEGKWYSKHLARMREPVLTTVAQDKERQVYRLTILPTWGNPIAVRVEKKGSVYSLFSRRLDGEGGYDPGNIVEKKEFKLSEPDTKALDELISSLRFYGMPLEDGITGNDGEVWIFEGASEGRYHMVKRWSAAGKDTKKRGLEPFVALCNFLVDKSGLSDRPKNRGLGLLPH